MYEERTVVTTDIFGNRSSVTTRQHPQQIVVHPIQVNQKLDQMQIDQQASEMASEYIGSAAAVGLAAGLGLGLLGLLVMKKKS